ncbi:hypothetical protein ACOMHN_023223 [Nucella lapillus]
MADLAMDMLEEASCVLSPASGKPLQIRVGLHSGGVVAGVMGKKRPRYDIYGDSVNTASRMMSYSVAGRIHISFTTFNLLYPYGYLFRSRGDILVKGKSLMKTYFLLCHSNRIRMEPADIFKDLPIVINPDPKLQAPRNLITRVRSAPIQKLDFVDMEVISVNNRSITREVSSSELTSELTESLE